MKQLFLATLALVGSICIFSACSDEEGAVGEQLLGSGRINVSFVESSKTKIATQKDIKSDLSSFSTALIGTLNDDIFGKTNTGAAFQVRLPGPIKLNEPQIDSVKLYLAYKNYYGADTALMQNARVFLLKESLKFGEVYNAETDVDALLGEEVGNKLFNKHLASDTIFLKSKVDKTKDSVINSKKQVDTIIRHLVINLDKNKVGQYILNGSDSDFKSSKDFVNYFKGLYVKTDDVSGRQGAIYGFDIYNSQMAIYFKNRRAEKAPNDTLYRASFYLPVTDNSVRFNKPSFSLKANITSNKDNIYLQGVRGTKARIDMPEINQWKDSTNVSINKAELVFQIAVDSDAAKKYPLPSRLELVAVDKDGKREFLNYSAQLATIPNGLLNLKDKVYSFHIPEYLQRIVKKKTTLDHFEISTGSLSARIISDRNGRRQVFAPVSSKDVADRVVLHNSGDKKPALKITYTKY